MQHVAPDSEVIESRVSTYLKKVAAAGGYRNYERDHLNALSGIFVPKFSRVLPPEMVRRVVEYAFDVGGH